MSVDKYRKAVVDRYGDKFCPKSNYVILGSELSKRGVTCEDLRGITDPHLNQVVLSYNMSLISSSEFLNGYNSGVFENYDDYCEKAIDVENEVGSYVSSVAFDDLDEYVGIAVDEICRQVWEDYQESLKEDK